MTDDKAFRKLGISMQLNKALLEGGEMPYSLYEHELEEHIDYWYASLQEDNNDFVFAVTENTGHVSMVLIMPDKTLYINEDGREKLSELWADAYELNIKKMIPTWVDQLADDIFPFNGAKSVPEVS